MVDIEIPRDIRVYESKLIGPFTTRQAVCFSIGGVGALIVYNTMTDILSRDAMFGVCFLLMVPCVFMGWVKPYGMSPEKFLLTAFVSNVLSPKRRLYKSEMQYMDLPSAEEIKEEKKRLKAYKKKKHKKKPSEFKSYR